LLLRADGSSRKHPCGATDSSNDSSLRPQTATP